MAFDVILESASIYDGAGTQPITNDIGLRGERIAAIGNLKQAEAAQRVDCRGLAACPGFVDIHSHADMTLHRENHPALLEPLVRQGITTFVGGNCGVSMAPVSREHRRHQMSFYDFFLGEDPEPLVRWNSFGELLDHYERQGMVMNAAVLAPHGMLRLDAMADRDGPPAVPELKQMKAALAECMEAGAVGLSTGLMYFPGLMSDEWELAELARVVHDYNGVFTSHLRSYNSDTLEAAIDEVLHVGREAEVPVQISHLFWIPNYPRPFDDWSKKGVKFLSALHKKRPFKMPLDFGIRPILHKLDGLIAQGAAIGIDAMPTSAGFTHLIAFFPPWSLAGGWSEIKKRLADPQTRREIRRSIEEGEPVWPHRGQDSWSMNLFKVMGWDCAYIMSVKSKKNAHLIGHGFAELADETGKHPFDVACDLLLEEEGRVLIFETATYPGDPLIEQSLRGTLLDPNVSIVTDTILLGFGMPSHLFYDCYPKFLGEYARERGELSLTEAIRKCTSLPTRQLRIASRGMIREGWFADLVVFDEKRIRSRSSAADPAHYPDGVRYVFINGRAVVDPDGYHPQPLAGRLIRRGH
ncbi:MAG: D-aminoacylase [Myxococcales bacterium]|nr:MAG: D-aminoacylase [Myxococcales bacterium]